MDCDHVTNTTIGKERLAKDKRGTKILLLKVMDNIVIFMHDCDIPFEIKEQLVNTQLHLVML